MPAMIVFAHLAGPSPELDWCSTELAHVQLRVQAKIRHRHDPAEAVIEKTGEDEVQVTFDVPQRAITPGQAVVFYDGDT